MDIAKERSAVDLADRCRGAIWGQFIGDAACLGAHWIYNLGELSQKFPNGVAGFEAPAQGQYHAGKRSGDFTHYGDAALLMLQSVAELGYFSAMDFGPRFIAFFSSEKYGERGGYLDHATKGTIENYRASTQKRRGTSYHFQGGADDDQPATATRIAPVVVNLCREGSLLKVVENATRVCQNNERAVVYLKCHALILKELLTGSALSEAVKGAAMAVSGDGEFGSELAGAIETVFGQLGTDVRTATLHFGQSCPLQNSFPAALHCALRNEGDLQRAILETANAGGDNAARAAMIGSWLGALHGMEAIPKEWRDKLNARDEIDRCVEKIVAKAAR